MSPERFPQEIPNARMDDLCCIGCGHALRGVTSRTCPECGRGFDPDDPHTTSRLRNRGFRRGLIGTCRVLHWALLLFAAGLILHSGLGGHWLLVAMVVVCSLPLMFLQFILLALPMQPISMRRRLLGYVVLLVIVSIPFTDWPIRVNFKLHQTSLQAVADRVTSGEEITGEFSIGAFRFRRIGTTHNHADHIGFQINGGSHGGMYFVATPPGFVAEPSSRKPLRNLGNVWDNTNWTVDLGNGWYLVEQD